MIFHISIEADDPERTARMMAEIWRGKAYPFPPVGKGSWVAMAGDERNSTVEVYPRGTELHEAAGDVQAGRATALPATPCPRAAGPRGSRRRPQAGPAGTRSALDAWGCRPVPAPAADPDSATITPASN